MSHEVDEVLGRGLRYTEKQCPGEWRGPYRSCSLWTDGSTEPASSLRIFSLSIRFGAVSVAAEGYGGVQTLPEHRGKGLARALMDRSLAGAARRVHVVFLYGIEKLYSRIGFVSCLPESSLWLRVRNVEAVRPERHVIAPVEPGEIGELAALYNREHHARPWTAVRVEAPVARLPRPTAWRPNPEIITARLDGRIGGYAVLAGISYGQAPTAFSVSELTACDDGCARALLRAAAHVSWERRIDTFAVSEPPDGTVGSAARRIGCEVRQLYVPDGEGMGRILDRTALLDHLAPELARRAACARTGAAHLTGRETLDEPSRVALRALRERKVVPDDGVLLRLLLNAWSWRDAEQAGVPLPEAYASALRPWFPGPTPGLPTPHSHHMDRY